MKDKLSKDLSRFRDGELPHSRAEALRRAVEDSPELRRLENEFRDIGEQLRELDVPAGKPAEVAWSDVQRGLRLQDSDAEGGAGILGSRLKWAAAIMSTVFIALGLAVMQAGTVTATVGPAEVEWVSTEVPGASTMVYQDEETGLTVIWMMEEDTDENGNVDT